MSFLQTFQTIDEDDEEEEDPEFRYLSSDCGIQPSKRNNYGIPKDVIDMFRASSSSSSNEQTTNTLDDVINNRLENVNQNCFSLFTTWKNNGNLSTIEILIMICQKKISDIPKSTRWWTTGYLIYLGSIIHIKYLHLRYSFEIFYNFPNTLFNVHVKNEGK